mmetsp:Transcript_6652/g.9537  ORF Transcript_6652/g.9537 Transcript_6652/m.9537 type:complete len:248 (+) Transcript_6652:659-1402(+)
MSSRMLLTVCIGSHLLLLPSVLLFVRVDSSSPCPDDSVFCFFPSAAAEIWSVSILSFSRFRLACNSESSFPRVEPEISSLFAFSSVSQRLESDFASSFPFVTVLPSSSFAGLSSLFFHAMAGTEISSQFGVVLMIKTVPRHPVSYTRNGPELTLTLPCLLVPLFTFALAPRRTASAETPFFKRAISSSRVRVLFVDDDDDETLFDDDSPEARLSCVASTALASDDNDDDVFSPPPSTLLLISVPDEE